MEMGQVRADNHDTAGEHSMAAPYSFPVCTHEFNGF